MAYVVIALAVIVFRRFNATYALLFITSMLAVNLIDIDHSNGDVTLLVGCGLVDNATNPLAQTCVNELHRGIFHTNDGFTLGQLILYFASMWAYMKKRWGLLVILTGLQVGWMLHMFLDNLLLPDVLGFSNSLM